MTVTTGRPTLLPTASIDFDSLFQQLSAQAARETYSRPILAQDVQQALAAFLNARADRRLSITRQTVVLDELQTLLNWSPTQEPKITISDADGDDRLDVLVTLPTAGLPGFIIRNQPDGFAGYQVPTPALVARDALVSFERVADLDGDGQPEIAVTTQSVGASAVNTLVTIARWDGEGFNPLFKTGISDWAGPAGWEFVSEGETVALVTTCPALGPYDHKLLPHPTLTRTFRWEAGNLILSTVSLDPPATVRQQVNVAESAFRQGRLDQALAAYIRAAEDPNLADEPGTAQVAWRAYARFRIGEIEALRGSVDAARQAMEQAKAAGPALSVLAAAFLDGYSNGDAARALAALQRTELAELLYFDEGGNLGPPMEAGDLLYPGLAVAAYLNAHPDAGHGSGEVLTNMLRDLSLDVASSAIVDLDGDGQSEVIVVLNQSVPKEVAPSGQRQSMWLLTRGNAGWWPQEIETGPHLMMTETVPAPEDGRRVVVYVRDSNDSPRRAAIGWDGTQTLRYNLPDGASLVRVAGDDLFECKIP